MGRRAILIASAILLMVGPAFARDFDPPESRYDSDRSDEEFALTPQPDFEGGPGGSVCVTSRGNCVVDPAPPRSPCGCMIPGFGPKRGAIGD